MVLKVIRALLGANVDEAVNGVVTAAAAANPTAATAAHLRLLEDSVTEASQVVARFRAKVDKERKEQVAAQQEFDRNVAAAQRLKKKMEEVTDPTVKAEMQTAFGELVTKLEQAKVRLDQETKDVDLAVQDLSRAEESLKRASEQLRKAERESQEVQDALERAKQAKVRAAERAEDQAVLAGLRKNEVNGMTGALDALKKKTAQLEQEANAIETKADALSEVRSAAQGNKYIAEALSEVDGTASTTSADDRFAALLASTK